MRIEICITFAVEADEKKTSTAHPKILPAVGWNSNAFWMSVATDDVTPGSIIIADTAPVEIQKRLYLAQDPVLPQHVGIVEGIFRHYL